MFYTKHYRQQTKRRIMMKKLLSVILTLVMLYSMSVTAFAIDSEEFEDTNSIYATMPGGKDGWAYIGEMYGTTYSGSSRILVSDAAWFRALRDSYPYYESHYTSNSSLEGTSMGYIINQNTCPNFAIGTKHMSGVGCEIAATYNALKLRGRIISCSSIIRSFEKDGYLISALTTADLGSDPYAIGDYLSDNYISYTQYTDYDTMKTAVNDSIGSFDVYIVSFWNGDGITGGLHTVAFYTSSVDSKVYVYNLYSDSTSVEPKDSFASFVNSNRFIVGYNVPQLRRNIEN
jgi:hypothetical protein